MNNVSTDPVRDPDFLAAMRELDDYLKGQPARYLALPAPRPTPPVLTPFNVPVIDGPAVDSRACVLRHLAVRKTVQPRIRDVLFYGDKVGQIVNVRPLAWMASTRRWEVFYSQTDAALAVWLDVQP